MHRYRLAVVALVLAACGREQAPPATATQPARPLPEVTVPSIDGEWRAVLESPGGELPFGLRIEEAGSPPAVAINGDEQVPFTSVRVVDGRVMLEIAGYDSRIVAQVSSDGRTMTGEWSKTAPEGVSRLPFRAALGYAHRFAPGEVSEPGGTVDGDWRVVFTEDDATTFPARAVLEQDGTAVRGTFLTETGDYRYLDGQLRSGRLSLSCFDGGHAFLFTATLADDALTGDFWSRDTYHATWTATRLPKGAADGLGDPFELVRLTNDQGRLEFAFPDPDGEVLSSSDPRFDGKVVLVDIFGTWCPNCNDQAPLLAKWHRTYGERGLELVGLAYEFTGNAKRDGEMIRRYAQRHGIEFPILLAGISDKAAASKTLPDLSAVKAYPTTVLVGRDGKVRKIYSGFAGPATGDRHTELVRDLEREIEALLAEPAPT